MDRMKRSYLVAGHCFTVEADAALLSEMSQYEPFICDKPESEIFSVTVLSSDTSISYTEEFHQTEEEQEIISGNDASGSPVLEFRLNGKSAGIVVCEDHYHSSRLYLSGDYQAFALNNALMILYALNTACMQTALFHSSTVSYQGKGYMFLGKSGTGKSTHSQLWIKNIEGCELINDDNPVVRIHDGVARVYGSPWSGKTPCYRHVDFPVGGIVQLKQATFNRIQSLKGVAAYKYLLTSVSGMRWNQQMANGIHEMENLLIATVPMWFLECLPDAEAAKLCNKTITA